MTACALIGVPVVLVALLSAASVPNVLESTTFCCSSPDAWSGVPANVGVGLAAIAVDAALWVVAWWLYSAEVQWRRFRRVVGGSVAVALVIVGATLVVGADNAVVSPNCDRYEFDREAFLSGGRGLEGSDGGRRSQSVGIADCGVLQGKSRTQVRALLGAPDGDGSRSVENPDISWRYGQLTIFFVANRVTSADMALDPGFEMS